MQARSTKKPFVIVLSFPNGMTRSVKVKATSREKAEERALKFHPSATGVKRGAL